MCVVKFSLVKHTCKIKKYIYSLHFLFLNRCIKNLPREKFPFAPQVNFIRTHYLLPTW